MRPSFGAVATKNIFCSAMNCLISGVTVLNHSDIGFPRCSMLLGTLYLDGAPIEAQARRRAVRRKCWHFSVDGIRIALKRYLKGNSRKSRRTSPWQNTLSSS
jgi:hypothetical protein